jgi:hypothetical protein
MRLFDGDKLFVSPFIIAPVAKLGREAVQVVGPEAIPGRLEIDELFDDARTRSGRAVPFLIRFRRKGDRVISVATIRSDVPEARSGREGLFAALGIVTSLNAFWYHEKVLSPALGMLCSYLGERFGAPIEKVGVSEMLSRLQLPAADLDEIFEGVDNLVRDLEIHFSNDYKEPPSLRWLVHLRLHAWRICKKGWSYPCKSLDDALEYLEFLDERFSSRVPRSPVLIKRSAQR